MSAHYKSLARRTNPKTVAVFPLNGTVLLPGCELPLNIFEPRYLNIDFTSFVDDADIHDPKAIPEAMSDVGGTDRAALTVAMKSLAKALRVSVDWEGLAEIPLPQLVNQAAMISPFKPSDKQSLLEAVTPDDRRRLLTGLLHLYATTGGDTPDQLMN